MTGVEKDPDGGVIPTAPGRDVQEKERRDAKGKKKNGMGLQLVLLSYLGGFRRCGSGSRSVSVADVKVWMKVHAVCQCLSKLSVERGFQLE
jgi:hypothetical protein